MTAWLVPSGPVQMESPKMAISAMTAWVEASATFWKGHGAPRSLRKELRPEHALVARWLEAG